MTAHKRSIFDWLTIIAAWCGVGLGIWTAVYQYRQDQRAPDIGYGQFGAKFTTTDEPSPRAYWRMCLSNNGVAAGHDVRVKLWDVPKSAEIWCSIASTIEERTADTLIVKIPVIPPATIAFLAVKPFLLESQKLMPYSPSVYNADGRAGRPDWLCDFAKGQVFEVVGRTANFVDGVCGGRRNYDTAITADDLDWAHHNFSVEDR